MKPSLGNTTFYGLKDQAKSDRATCFIGVGSAASSTHRYMLAWGVLANAGNYTPESIVFISAEGNRAGRKQPPFDEIARACQARARIITDVPADRERSYNIGERQVAEFLLTQGYHEVAKGCWIPNA